MSGDGIPEAAVVRDLTIAASDPAQIIPAVAPDPHVVVVPEGGEVQTLDFESFLDAPRRKSGVYRPATVEAFMDYVAGHASSAHTTVWVDQLELRLAALINDHAPEESGWGDHRAVTQLVKTPQWEHWLAKDGAYSTQEDFADHLQEGISEISDPPAAEMLEIAQTFQGKTSVEWKSANRVNTGEISFAYQETVQARAGVRGDVQVPDQMTLTVAPIYGSDVFDVTARIRYKIREGHLQIGYKLERPHEVELEVMDAIATQLKGQFDNVFLGTPR